MSAENEKVKMPWADHLGDVPLHLDYFEGSMYDAVRKIADERPNGIAYDFMGRSTKYEDFLRETEKIARSLKALGVKKGDKITVAMPNCPQAVCLFYAINLAGAIANMIHPLSAEKEIEFFLNDSESVAAVTLDQFYEKFARASKNTKIKHLIIAKIQDALSLPVKIGYILRGKLCTIG